MSIDRCRSCQAVICWVVLTGSGKFMPVDADGAGWPVGHPDGNVHPTGERRRGKRVVEVGYPLDGWVSHFATCPDSAGWRRRSPSPDEE